MRTTRRIAAGLLLISLLGGCSGGTDRAGGGSPAPPRVLRFVTASGVPEQVAAWAQEVERASHGTLRIRFSPGWRSDDPSGEVDTLGDVRAGRVALAWVGARVFDRVGVTAFQPLLAPFLVDSYPLEQRVFADPLVTQMASQVSSVGVAGLAVLPGPIRRMLGVRHPFLQPSDFAGSVIGMQDSGQSEETLRLLGATPRAVPAETALDGLDGYEQQLAAIAGNSNLHTARYITSNVDLWPRPLVIIANQRTLSGLTSLQRSALRGAGRAVMWRAMLAAASEDSAAMGTLCANGSLHTVTATLADLRALRSAVRPIYRGLATQRSQRDALQRIRSLKQAIAVPPSSVPSCQGGQAGPAGATAADGTYQVSIAEADLPADDRLPESYGTWTVVIDHGRFRFSQASDGADWMADGSVVVSGDTMTWVVAHALDVGPHGAPDGVQLFGGQRVRFRWHRTGLGLELSSLDSPAALPALSVRPLPRVADAPGQQHRINAAPLQGVWTMDVTGADVIAHHDDPAGIAGNTGRLRLTIQGSRFRWTQQAPDGQHFAMGTWSVAGDTLELTSTRTDETTAAAPFFFYWSIYKDHLVLRQAPGFSPEGWAYHPWSRGG